MEKHRFNIFPEMSKEEFGVLKNDILTNGYDQAQPIVIFEGDILDGWNRYHACEVLGIEAPTRNFKGGFIAAIEFVMRSNKRRNLSSGQWACIAVEADELVDGIRAETERVRLERQKKNAANQHSEPSGNKFPEGSTKKKGSSSTKTATKVAKIFNTNERYVKDAAKLKKEDPSAFADVKSGKTTMTKVTKGRKIAKRKEEIEETLKSELKIIPTVLHEDVNEFLTDIEDGSVDLLITDPPYSTNVDDIDSFAKMWLQPALKKVKDTGYAFVFIGAYPKEIKAYLNIELPTQILIWEYKNTLGNNPKDRYKLNYQAILFYRMPNAGDLNIDVTGEQWAVHNINAPDGRQGDRYHAWQKPIELAERLIRHTTHDGDKIIDPFCCTGTFLLAATKMGRTAIGGDNSKENLEIAIKRGCEFG